MGCPLRVKAVLAGLPGVLGSTVDVLRGRVTVRYDAARFDASEIAARIDASATYDASPPLALRAVARLRGHRWTASLDLRSLANQAPRGIVFLHPPADAPPVAVRAESDPGIRIDPTPATLDPGTGAPLPLPFALEPGLPEIRRIRITLTRGQDVATLVLPIPPDEDYAAGVTR